MNNYIALPAYICLKGGRIRRVPVKVGKRYLFGHKCERPFHVVVTQVCEPVYAADNLWHWAEGYRVYANGEVKPI